MHSLSDKVLLRYYDSQFPSSETGNLGSWVALGLEFLNLVKTNPNMFHGKGRCLRRFSPTQFMVKNIGF